MISSEQTWKFGQDERFVRSWHHPDAPPSSHSREIVLGVVHGLGDHSGRFDALGRWFAGRGIRVYAFDQVGHGKSPGRRMLIPCYEALLDDVDIFLNRLTERHPDASVGLLGQSMGGNFVLNHQLRGYSKMAWMIAGSPMLRAVNQPGPICLFLLRLFAKIRPDYVLNSSVDPARLSRDPAMQRAFMEDPLVQQRISLRLGKALIDSGRWALDHAEQLTTPTLITHGDADLITCHRASVEFAQRTRGRAVTKIWAQGTHDLHHDIIRDDYLSSVFDWIVAEVTNQDS
ncbi:Phospholipase YtpA [Stieleria neptunia]|uniref:Phospholipase YtpA n=2 Tax=Stieleria neptunia TaxID=2527979 RepID=A0A518HWV5_9BACT|nr:Phospholipase YtpA [Stieleria neptunia]